VAVFLVISVVSRKLRSLVWLNLGRAFAWLFSIKPMTRTARALLEQVGYERRSSEVAEERKRAFEPSWRIEARDSLGEKNLHWLNNDGFVVQDVSLTCDPEFFVLEGEVAWKGGFGSDTPGSVGNFFRGIATELGKSEGVAFIVRWTDRYGDHHQRAVPLRPDEILAGHSEALDDQFAKGRVAGRAEVFAEKTPALPPPPPPEPRWVLTELAESKGRLVAYEIANLIPGSVALNARIDPSRKSAFRFDDAAFWPNLSGEASGVFRGRVTDSGAKAGFNLVLSWLDANRNQQTESWNVPATEADDVWNTATPF
jgi:hypothetical protein